MTAGVGAAPSSVPVPPSASASGGKQWLSADFQRHWPGATVSFVSITQPDGKEFALSAVLPQPNQVVGYVGTPPADPRRDSPKDPEVDLLTVSDSSRAKLVEIDTKTAPMESGFESDGTSLTWVSARDPDFVSWRVWSTPLDRSAPATVLASAPTQSNGTPVWSVRVQPHSDHGIVVWGAISPDPPIGSHSAVYAASVGQPSSVTVIATDASAPAISWPLVVYNQHTGETFSKGELGLTLYDLRTRTTRKLDGIVNASYWAIGGNRVAWVDSTRKKLYLRDLGPGSSDVLVQDVSKSLTAQLQFPALNDSFLAWSAEGGEWLYDIGRKQAVQVTEHPLYNSIYLRGNTAAWTVGIPQSDPEWKPWHGLRGYYVADLRSLH